MMRSRKWMLPLAALLCMALLATPALAADAAITFLGEEEGFTFAPGSGYTPSDLFDNFKDVMPGDTRTQAVQVTNEATDSDYIRLYLRPVAHDENGNPLTYDEAFENADGKDFADVDGERDETVAGMLDYLAQLRVRVTVGETVIFEGAPTGLPQGDLPEDAPTGAIYLGQLESGDSLQLDVELQVPIELDNDYANRVGEVDWEFVAEGYEHTSPDTGDDANLYRYGALVLVALAGLAAVLLAGKRRKENA